MKIFFLLVLSAISAFTPFDDFYSLSIKNIDGESVNLSAYQGKKILFVVLPLSATDTTITKGELIQLQQKFPNAHVIGIPSIESGFSPSAQATLKALYQNAGTHFTLAEGMYVKKASSQHSLFHWLTNKEKNRHFDQDVEGIGSKFFVNEAGELYAVIGAQVKLSHPVIDRILSRPTSNGSNPGGN